MASRIAQIQEVESGESAGHPAADFDGEEGWPVETHRQLAAGRLVDVVIYGAGVLNCNR
jgi:hypothetical protein